MSQYLILIYEDEARYAGATPEVFGQISQEHTDWMASVEQSGAKLLGGDDEADGGADGGGQGYDLVGLMAQRQQDSRNTH